MGWAGPLLRAQDVGSGNCDSSGHFEASRGDKDTRRVASVLPQCAPEPSISYANVERFADLWRAGAAAFYAPRITPMPRTRNVLFKNYAVLPFALRAIAVPK